MRKPTLPAPGGALLREYREGSDERQDLRNLGGGPVGALMEKGVQGLPVGEAAALLPVEAGEEEGPGPDKGNGAGDRA